MWRSLRSRAGLALGIVLLAFAAAGCGGSSSPATPTNPSSTAVTVSNAAGLPLNGITVTLSTGLNGQTPTGVIATVTTGTNGQVTFSLPSTGLLCVSATVTLGGSTTFSGSCHSPPFPSTTTITLNV
ncbi:MAG: hypothetical protein ABSB70_16420 [Candidatus Velthaea sp.]|jgi:hypothetical protein